MPVSAMSVGFGNYVILERVIAIVSSDSAPMRRAIQEARKMGQLIDATQGRRTKTIIFMDNGQILISGLSQETLAKRASVLVPMAEQGDADLG